VFSKREKNGSIESKRKKICFEKNEPQKQFKILKRPTQKKLTPILHCGR